MFVAVAPAALEPKVKKVMVEIVPCGGTYDVYRKGGFLQQIGPDLSPLSIVATERKTLPAECKTKKVDFAPLGSEARTKAGIYDVARKIDTRHALQYRLRTYGSAPTGDLEAAG